MKIPRKKTDTLLSRAARHTQHDQLEQAISCYRKIIARHPGHFAANANLGNLLFRLGRMDEAIGSYMKAAEIEADNVIVYCNLGMALSAVTRYSEAVRYYRKALKLEPDSAATYLVMGNTLTSLGEFEEALASFRKASRIAPGYTDALAGEAGVLERLGRHEEAHRITRRLVEADPVNTSTAVVYASVAKHFHEEEKACAVVERTLKNPGLTAMQQLELHFAAGRLLDGLGEYDSAFAHFDKGNALAPRRYNVDMDKQFFDAIIAAFPKQAFAEACRGDSDFDKAVFVLGMPRSGTSLVEQILASHLRVYGAGELRQLQTIANKICTDSATRSLFPCNVSGLPKESIHTAADEHRQFLEQLGGGARRVVDKMPHNFLYIGLIAVLFPGARIIHCTRHPLDTCLSIYFQYFGGSNDYAYNLESLGTHYCHYVRLMQHWKSLGIPMLDVSYEALVADPEKISRQLVDYCGLEWDACCLDFHQSDRLSRTASYDQVRKPIYSGSVSRWKYYEKHLRPLIEHFQQAGLI